MLILEPVGKETAGFAEIAAHKPVSHLHGIVSADLIEKNMTATEDTGSPLSLIHGKITNNFSRGPKGTFKAGFVGVSDDRGGCIIGITDDRLKEWGGRQENPFFFISMDQQGKEENQN